jgi:hypothetical protein
MQFQLCPTLAIHQRESATNKHVPWSQNNKVQLQVCTIEEKQAPWLRSESERGEENMRMGRKRGRGNPKCEGARI